MFPGLQYADDGGELCAEHLRNISLVMQKVERPLLIRGQWEYASFISPWKPLIPSLCHLQRIVQNTWWSTLSIDWLATPEAVADLRRRWDVKWQTFLAVDVPTLFRSQKNIQREGITTYATELDQLASLVPWAAQGQAVTLREVDLCVESSEELLKLHRATEPFGNAHGLEPSLEWGHRLGSSSSERGKRSLPSPISFQLPE